MSNIKHEQWGGSLENCVGPAGVFSHAHFGYQHHHYMQIMVSIREICTLSILLGWSLYKIPKRDSFLLLNESLLGTMACLTNVVLYLWCSLIIIFVHLDQSKRERESREKDLLSCSQILSWFCNVTKLRIHVENKNLH